MKTTHYDLATESKRLKAIKAQLRAIREKSPEIYRGTLRNLRRNEMIRQGKQPAGVPYLHPGLRRTILKAMRGFAPSKEVAR